MKQETKNKIAKAQKNRWAKTRASHDKREAKQKTNQITDFLSRYDGKTIRIDRITGTDNFLVGEI